MTKFIIQEFEAPDTAAFLKTLEEFASKGWKLVTFIKLFRFTKYMAEVLYSYEE